MRYGPAPDEPPADEPAAPDSEPVTGLAFTRAQAARRYDYWLGGKDNLAVDRESGDAVAKIFPDVALAARESRRFMQRAVGFLADDLGIRQFLDVGVGYSSPPDVHEIAQAVDPAARVLYVDHDAVVGVHTRALMNSTPEGAVTFLLADLRRPDTILHGPQLHETLDMDRPVALLLMAVLHFVDDAARPLDAVRHLVGALAPGSYVALSHGTADFLRPGTGELIRAQSGPKHGTLNPRTRDEVASFVEHLRLLSPGLVPVVDWHPGREPRPSATVAQASAYGVVAKVV